MEEEYEQHQEEVDLVGIDQQEVVRHTLLLEVHLSVVSILQQKEAHKEVDTVVV